MVDVNDGLWPFQRPVACPNQLFMYVCMAAFPGGDVVGCRRWYKGNEPR